MQNEQKSPDKLRFVCHFSCGYRNENRQCRIAPHWRGSEGLVVSAAGLWVASRNVPAHFNIANQEQA